MTFDVLIGQADDFDLLIAQELAKTGHPKFRPLERTL
jgi:hypothetical protein